jgi:ribosomal protein S18 acetylase RimI-like enzyme
MSEIRVIPFNREYAADFRRLNFDWIERLFKVEAADLKVLDDPEKAIVAKGGMIFFALDGEAVVGTVAMVRVSDERYELAKMAVATTHQRRGIGEMLGTAGVKWVAEQGGRSVFLQSNTKLDNALRLYERLGFRRAIDPSRTEYSRCDIYMELPIAAGGG